MLNLGVAELAKSFRQEFRRLGRIHWDLPLEVAESLRGFRYARTPNLRLDTALVLPEFVVVAEGGLAQIWQKQYERRASLVHNRIIRRRNCSLTNRYRAWSIFCSITS